MVCALAHAMLPRTIRIASIFFMKSVFLVVSIKLTTSRKRKYGLNKNKVFLIDWCKESTSVNTELIFAVNWDVFVFEKCERKQAFNTDRMPAFVLVPVFYKTGMVIVISGAEQKVISPAFEGANINLRSGTLVVFVNNLSATAHDS